MTDYIKGGRGKRAPYETVIIRVPEPLKDVVYQLIEDYRVLIEEYGATGKVNCSISLYRDTEHDSEINPDNAVH